MRSRGRLAPTLVMALAMAIAMIVSGTASAAPTELIAGFGVVPRQSSPYRAAANSLGYANSGTDLHFEGELGALFAIAYHGLFSVGPFGRVAISRMRPAYDGLDSIAADSAALAVREELIVFPYPKFFVWADQSCGVSSIGTPGARTTLPVWGARGGLGLRVGEDAYGARFRIGYSWTPTIGRVSDATGAYYNFGGFVFAIDGVIRVAR